MSENLIEAFYEIIQEVSWITVETQDLVLERLEKLQILVGFQNFSENENVTLFEKDNLVIEPLCYSNKITFPMSF